MNAVTETAYYCCGVRMLDAEKKNSLLKDVYARRFMDSHGLQIFDSLKCLTRANMCSIVRAKIIDDHIKEILSKERNVQFALLGAGFDSRAFRIAGGHWIEIDEPVIIELKNAQLPTSSCSNPLTRIPADFSKDELGNILDRINHNNKTVFIIEGVFMYLAEREIHHTLSLMKSQFKSHDLIVDLMSASFIKDKMSDFLEQIGKFGCSFKFYHDAPKRFCEEQGYVSHLTTSVLQRASELKQFFAPKIILNILYPHLIKGYTVNWLHY